MKKYSLLMLSQNKLRPEDKCGIMKLAKSCDDMFIVVDQIYREVGR